MAILTCFLVATFVFFLINFFAVNHQTLMNNITQKLLSTFLSLLRVPIVYKYGHKSKNYVLLLFLTYHCSLSLGQIDDCPVFFHFNNKIPMLMRLRIVYHYKCQYCGALYFGKTRRHLHTRISEHMGVSPSTRQKAKHTFSLEHSRSYSSHSTRNFS